MRGLFYGIGHQPNSGIVEGQIELDDKGYVVVSTPWLQTSVLCGLQVYAILVCASTCLSRGPQGSSAPQHGHLRCQEL